MKSAPFRVVGDDVLLTVRLTPKAALDRIDGLGRDADGRMLLLARVRAVPEDGRANAALVASLAKRLKLPKSKLAIVSGHTARIKVVRIAGGAETLLPALTALAGEN